MGGLTMREKRKIAGEFAGRYRSARKKGKKNILNEFAILTKYTRNYASYLLRNWGKKISIWNNGKQFIFILGARPQKMKRKRGKTYGVKFLKTLKKIWALSGYLCGKLLCGYIKENLTLLLNEGAIKLEKAEVTLLKQISAATIDRMLKPEKKTLLRKARSGTKPTTLLKYLIPIKTFTEWNRAKPGFLSIDLVQHEGGNPSGEFIQTLDVTDAATEWTETQAVLNKAHIWVLNAADDINRRMPFKVLGIHSDGGGEFINKPMKEYCENKKITFTHSRSNKKNDNCFVEQKNYSVVRKNVGYLRYEGETELKLLNMIYKKLRLITNFLTPSMKLISKTRIGSKVMKKYDNPKTPYLRVLESPDVPDKIKEKLKKQRLTLKPIQLRKEMLALQDKLYKTAIRRKKRQAKFSHLSPNYSLPQSVDFVYNFR